MSTRYENPQMWIGKAVGLLQAQPEGTALGALGGFLLLIDGELIGTPSITHKHIDPDYVAEVSPIDWGLYSWDGYTEQDTDAALNEPAFVTIDSDALAEIKAHWANQF